MPGLEKTENEIRYRMKEPGLFIEDSVRTKQLEGVEGISIIIGKLTGGDSSMVTQAYRFDAEKWTMAEAEKWLRDHGEWKESDNAANAESAHALMKLSGVSLYSAREIMRGIGTRRSAVSLIQRGEDVFVYKKADKMEVVDIPRVEAFRSGKWTDSNGKTVEYSDADIEDMAASYNRLERQGGFEAPVKLGHDPEQPLTDGLPALGWLRNAIAEGGRLFFDLCEVPKKFAELIRQGAYKKRSMEIIHKYKDEETEKEIAHMPSGLAFLGATIPALGSLEAIGALYGSTHNVSKYAVGEVETPPPADDKYTETKKGKDGESSMTEEEQKVLDDLKAENEALKKELDDLKSKMAETSEESKASAAKQSDDFKAKFDELTAKCNALETKNATTEKENFKAKYSRKVTPADMELLVLPQYETIRTGGDVEKMSAFTKALDGRKDHGLLSEYGHGSAGDPPGAEEDVVEKAKAAATKDGKVWSKLSTHESAEYLMAAGYSASSYADEREVQ